MTINASDKIWIDARITPNLSASRRGLTLIGAALLAPAIFFGVVLTVLKAWPATLFLVGEAGLAVAALNWSAKRLSEQGERILLTDRHLTVERWDCGIVVSRQALDPNWARIERSMHEAFGCEGVFLRIRTHRVRVAHALSPSERIDLADALELALQKRKTGLAKETA